MNRIAHTVSTGIIASLSLAALLIAGTASAETTRKPRVCVDFKTFEREKAVVGVCFDGKRRAIFTEWTTVRLAGPDGKPTAYTVGF